MPPCVLNLRKQAGLSKAEAVEEIKKLISLPSVETDEEVVVALGILEKYPIDKIVDAIGIAKALKRGYGLITNDETQAKVFESLSKI